MIAITSFDDIEPLSFVTWADRAMLPESSGLYFVTLGTEVIYIGRSGNLRNRWKQYPLRRVFEGAGPFAVAFMTIEDPDALKIAERQAIRAIRPALNTHYVEGSLEHWYAAHRRFYGPRKQPPTST